MEVKKTTSFACTLSLDLNLSVFSQYRCRVATGKMLVLSSNRGKKYSFITLPGWHCFESVSGDTDTPFVKRLRNERKGWSVQLTCLVSSEHTGSQPSWLTFVGECVNYPVDQAR